MSNSELFQVEKDPKVIGFNVLLRSTLEFSSDHGCLIASSLSQFEESGDQKKKDGKFEGGVSSPSSSSSVAVSDEEVIRTRDAGARTRTLGGELEMDEDEDDDGFRTPTSLEHRIPMIQHCPTAPRKPKSSLKRKASSSSICSPQLFQLDLSQEIESLFPPALLADLGRKIKKVHEGDDGIK